MTCVICQRDKPGLFSLEIPTDEENETYPVQVCGTCWDVIATIALRAVAAQEKKSNGGNTDEQESKTAAISPR